MTFLPSLGECNRSGPHFRRVEEVAAWGCSSWPCFRNSLTTFWQASASWNWYGTWETTCRQSLWVHSILDHRDADGQGTAVELAVLHSKLVD
jgi:hypothetical protein